MIERLFKKYIKWFDDLIYKRKVILLIDDFFVYKTNISLYADEIYEGFRNIIIIFLSKNAIAFCQSLNQGIIKAWKSHYRRKWLQYIINQINI